MKAMVVFLLVLFMCAGCREEVASAGHVQTDSATNRESDVRISATSRESDERISVIEREMSNMPQKLAGKGWDTLFWGNDLAKSIVELDDRNERIHLMNRYLNSLSQLEQLLNVHRSISQAFRNYELLLEPCVAFTGEPEIAERVLEVMCNCIRLHRQEVRKWADAINSEPNRRKRVPLKNIHGCLSSEFMVFTNRIERDYFPRIKSHGLSAERHEIWRKRIDDAAGRQ